MTNEAAHKINAAACHIFLFQQGLLLKLPMGYLDDLRGISHAQIEVASDIVQALNRDAKPVGGKTEFSLFLDPDSADRVKQYADTLRSKM